MCFGKVRCSKNPLGFTFKMALVVRLLFWGYLLNFSKFSIGESNSTTAHTTSVSLSCNHKIRVFFSSNTWSTQLGGGTNSPRQGQFFVAVMRQIVTTADDNGVNCTFNKMRYMLTCCDLGGSTKSYSLDRKEWTAHSKFWSYDVFRINIVFLFVNLFFLLLILGCGIHMLASNSPETMTQINYNDSIEMS